MEWLSNQEITVREYTHILYPLAQQGVQTATESFDVTEAPDIMGRKTDFPRPAEVRSKNGEGLGNDVVCSSTCRSRLQQP